MTHNSGGNPTHAVAEELADALEAEIRMGRVLIEEIVWRKIRPSGVPGPTGPSPQPTGSPGETLGWFEVQVVDELGMVFAGTKVRLSHGVKVTTLPTGGTGIVREDGVSDSFGWAEIVEDDTLVQMLRERWTPCRGVARAQWLKESVDRKVLQYRGAASLPSVSLEAKKRRIVSIQPGVPVARLLGFFFDTNKCFLLPWGLAAMASVVQVYNRYPRSELLVVGHTDTIATESESEALSLDRARSMKAFLLDDVASWLTWYSEAKPKDKRWGIYEDMVMIQALAAGYGFSLEGNPVLAYQKWHNIDGRAGNWELLEPNGILDKETRAQLIGDYMNWDRTSLPAATKVTVHGCGEAFPLDEQGELDPTPQDGQQDPMDRRVELFFFDRELGILPPVEDGSVSKKGSQEYPEWRRRQIIETEIDLRPRKLLISAVDVEDRPVHPGTVSLEMVGVVMAEGQLNVEGTCSLAAVLPGQARLRIRGINELQLASAGPLASSAVTAFELDRGILIDTNTAEIRIVVGLGELQLFMEESSLFPRATEATLFSGDGAYSMRFPLEFGGATDVARMSLFSGLPTLGKVYTLKTHDASGDRVVFQALTLDQLQSNIELSRNSLAEPTPDPDKRLAWIEATNASDAGGVVV